MNEIDELSTACRMYSSMGQTIAESRRAALEERGKGRERETET